MKTSITDYAGINDFYDDLLDRAADLNHKFTQEEMLNVSEAMFQKLIAVRVSTSMANILNSNYTQDTNGWTKRKYLDQILYQHGLKLTDSGMEITSLEQLKRASPALTQKLKELEDAQWAHIEPILLKAIDQEIEDLKKAPQKMIFKKLKAAVSREITRMIEYDSQDKLARALVNRLYFEVKETSKVPMLWLAVLDKSLNQE